MTGRCECGAEFTRKRVGRPRQRCERCAKIRHRSTAVNSANQLAYRARKRAKGICTVGGCWEPTGGPVLCEKHLADRRYRRKMAQWRLENGCLRG